jgi:hypothetical protein
MRVFEKGRVRERQEPWVKKKKKEPQNRPESRIKNEERRSVSAKDRGKKRVLKKRVRVGS